MKEIHEHFVRCRRIELARPQEAGQHHVIHPPHLVHSRSYTQASELHVINHLTAGVDVVDLPSKRMREARF